MNALSQLHKQMMIEADIREWSICRYKIASSAAHAMIQRSGLSGVLDAGDVARKSVEFADALIAELRKPLPDEAG